MNPKRCAACKYLRRRCPKDCVFSPYFPPNDPQKFACVHRIYGAGNVSKMLQQLPDQTRAEAVESLCFEAKCRVDDPVYGCVGIIHLLKTQIQKTQNELAKTQAEIAVSQTKLSQTQNSDFM
ncbi:LOB domain-containing protein 23 [Arabidopsis thaliana]|uniref:Lateral organ boundaries LOB n=2 Tax=Arabidopsis TaxID=3701 RepID=A0A8T2ERR3_9BRAS|nr:Lateral organ boundaries LOB [Arabidopsis thaliana x Arabidopsis arenosa]KAG7626687.1 Lateral organ boundaries LOB [Arabidopsis thaliana x Arabidopsis arenosa]CAD5324224.1 unnamed protein product [Arabidopsis thaliana]VYS58709.1 unnamed protein product [Arabidopsis thaliana]